MTDTSADAPPCHVCTDAQSPRCPGIGYCPVILAWLDGADVLTADIDGQKTVTEGGSRERD